MVHDFSDPAIHCKVPAILPGPEVRGQLNPIADGDLAVVISRIGDEQVDGPPGEGVQGLLLAHRLPVMSIHLNPALGMRFNPVQHLFDHQEPHVPFRVDRFVDQSERLFLRRDRKGHPRCEKPDRA